MAAQDNARTPADDHLLPALPAQAHPSPAQAPGRCGGENAAPVARKALTAGAPERYARPPGANREGQWAQRACRESQGPAAAAPEPPNWSRCLLNKAIGPNGESVRIPPGWSCPFSPCCGMGSLMVLLEAVAGDATPDK